jgi:3D (Asp-Asp-Asp) domain-containing protein
MNLQTTVKGVVRGSLAESVAIALMTVIGVIANIDTFALDSPVSEHIITQHSRQYSVSSAKPVKYTVRRVTAYNVGDPAQTDASPCIGAGNENLCRALAQGEKVCAANFVPLNTYLHIREYGICRVADRMHGRFKNGVDIAMGAHHKHKAVKFGVQDLPVRVLD